MSVLPAVTNAAPAASPIRTLHIGVLYWSMNIPGQVAMRSGLEAQARHLNDTARQHGQPQLELLPMVAGDGAAGVERQVSQMFDMVRRKPDVIVVQPTDNAALAGPLRAANQAGIPVVAYDQYISGGNMAAYITSDNRQAGYLDGEYVAAQFPDDKAIRLVLVEYPRVSSTVERLNGFLDALRDQGQAYKILKSYEAVEPVAGQLAGQQMLHDFSAKGSVDAVFAVNDGGGVSVVDVLAAAGRSEIMVASIDGDPKSVDNVRAGRLTRIDSAQFCGPLGAQAISAAYAIATGKSVPRQALVPVFPITRETLDRYPGWDGPIPDQFTKPWQARNPVWRGDIKFANDGK
ncbi:sugar ABC transporter substrate-binding protein [Rhodoferax sp.]|uniref:sugar ABC transporter substrate-binding protein n=1 Tax=Rhodoferax sp. TaxID=50421 RepID=UPI002840601E|nr:sugar ABC transporter substrate-binding protein [Rhodoferax sp.]MDR3371861.1 sugar ABC transporter substrate-binding protein [Rhodoferax sp.]